MKLVKYGLIILLIGLSFQTPYAANAADEVTQEITAPTFPSCASLSGTPGDLAHFTSGLHQIAGAGLLSGADDVYALTDGNAVQCFCPATGMGIQTNWWKTDATMAGWIQIENGSAWNLSDSAYLAMHSDFDCNQGANITVTKVVVNDNDGTAVAGDFLLKVGQAVVTSGVLATNFPAGTYMITESEGPAGYTASFSGDCDDTGQITMVLGHTYTCTITNNDIGGTGGSGETICPSGNAAVILAGPRGSGDSFTTNSSGTQATVSFQIAEGCDNINVTALSFRRAVDEVLLPQALIDKATGTFSFDDGATHTLTVDLPPCSMQADIVLGVFDATELNSSNFDDVNSRALDWIFNHIPCTNPFLTVTKVIINDNGGTAQVSQVNLSVGSTAVVSGTQSSFAPGAYTVTETGAIAGYTAMFSGDCDSTGKITLNFNDVKTCTITNNDNAPSVTVIGPNINVPAGNNNTNPPPVVTIVTPPVITINQPEGQVLGVSTETPVQEEVAVGTVPVGGVAAGKANASFEQLGWLILELLVVAAITIPIRKLHNYLG